MTIIWIQKKKKAFRHSLGDHILPVLGELDKLVLRCCELGWPKRDLCSSTCKALCWFIRGLHSSFSMAVFERFQPRFQFRFRYMDLAENDLLLWCPSFSLPFSSALQYYHSNLQLLSSIHTFSMPFSVSFLTSYHCYMHSIWWAMYRP